MMKIVSSLCQSFPKVRRHWRRRSTGSLSIYPVSAFTSPASPFHSATHGSSLPQEDALPGTLHGKLHQLKERTPTASAAPKAQPKDKFIDTVALIAGWGVVVLGLGLSLHGSRSMIDCHNELMQRRKSETLPVVEIRDVATIGETDVRYT